MRYDALPAPDTTLAARLLAWFEKHGRHFPWRVPTSAYHILCAEIFLQRTHASQVAPVFEEFRARYAGPADLLRAGTEAVVSIFNRLGLHWRGDRFWELNRTLVERFGGEVPRTEAGLHSLPGVGEYVATAVRVFAFGESLTVVDSNVIRIFSRYYGIVLPEHARRSRKVLHWATQMAPADPDACRRFNWALIDHGALLCVPGRPRVAACPLREGCAFALGREGS